MDYARNLYLSQEPVYQNFKEFLQREMGMTYEELLDDTKIEEMIQLLQELNNNTRMQIHRGHTPNEMVRREIE